MSARHQVPSTPTRARTPTDDKLDFFYKYRDETLLYDKKSIQEVFSHFDKNNNNFLEITEFDHLLKFLFIFNGTPYHVSKEKTELMFNFFNRKKNGKLSFDEFENFWYKIVKITLLPHTAFVIVDVQNDFITGTLSLLNCEAKQDGNEVVPVINKLIDSVPFNVIAYTLDWHPANHCSFIENVNDRKLSNHSPTKNNIKVYDTVIFEEYPDIDQKLWPAHCIENTPGSELHPNLNYIDERTDPHKRHVVVTKKGNKSDIDSYSAFFDNMKLNETTLNKDLKKYGVTDIYVCGLAADVCVAATSIDGLSLKYRTIFIDDASRGVNLDDIQAKKRNLEKNGAVIINAKQVYNMVIAKDRRPELAFFTLATLMEH